MKRIFSFTSHYSIRTFSYNQIIFSSHCTRIQSNLKFELYHRHLQLRDMSQKSITSFFSKTPKKVDKSTEANKVSKIKRERSESDEGTLNDQQVNVKINKKIKIENDISQVSPSKSRSSSPEITPNVKKNVKKRQVVESSDSDVSPAKKSPVLSEKVADKKSKDQKKSPKRGKKSPDPSEKVDDSKSKSQKKSPKRGKKSPDPSEKVDDSKSKSQKKSPKRGKKSPDPSEKVDDSKSKSQKKSPKRESQSPESEVKKEKEDIKSPLSEKDSNVSGSETKKKDGGLGGFFIKRDGGKETKVDPNLVSDIEYTPLKSNYHPINDACWSKDAKVPYIALTNTLQAIEDTSARLKMVELLSNFLRSVIVLSPDDLLPCVYLCLNKLAPAYEGIELGVAETYLMKAISQSTGRTLAQIKSDASKCGDLGIVAEQSKSNQRMMFKPASLTVAGVFKALKEVASMSGNTAMNKKVSKIQSVFVACRHSEAKYFIRSLAGKLRIGLAEQSVLQALAQATVTTPPRGDTWPPQVLNAAKGVSAEEFKSRIDEQALIIKTTYCQCPNYDMIIPVIITKGVSDLPSECKLTPGIPLKPMLAHPTKGIHEVFERFENLRFTCEWKYDGERAQIHIPSDGNGTIDLKRASIFSRNQENNTSKYPDVMTRLDKLCKEGVNSCVLDCEAIGWDVENKKILPFQILSTRKRKDANISDIKVQVCLFIFDLLYLNGEALVTKSLEHRRQLLKEHFNEVPGEWLFATSRDCSTMEEVQEFLEESIKGSCEGLMVKTLEGKDATYEIAKRSRNWLKLKKDYLDGVGDTLDVVVIGGYHGRGKRTGVYGGFLLACYDNESEEYQSICKIGTGFTEDDLMNHSNTLNQFVIDRPRSYYRYDSSHEPDVWFSAHEVWEVKCADLSLSPVHRAAMGLVNPDKGISLRFPRFVRIRDDKKAEEATSSRQVADIYLNQDQVKNQTSTSNSKNNMDDDFY